MTDGLENIEKRLGKAENAITALQVEVPHIREDLSRFYNIVEKLEQTMDALNNTMAQINFKTQEQDNKIAKNEKHIEEIEDKVESIEEDTKFNIVQFIKKNFPWLVVAGMLAVIGAKNMLGA